MKTFRSWLEEEKRENLLDHETELAIYRYTKPKEYAQLFKAWQKEDDPTWSFSDYLKRIVVADAEFERRELTGFKYKSELLAYELSREAVDFINPTE